ncbi:MAG: transporter [Ignavibacteriae bacterium]|nr:transporter [Ignavibacteriota bacterium]
MFRRNSKALFVVLIPLFTSWAQKPVLLTESPLTVGMHRVESGIGVEYLEKHQAPAPDFPETEIRALIASTRIGVSSNVDIDLDWRGKIFATYPGGATAADWGDLTVATKINLFSKAESLYSVGVRSAVKLPNTSYKPYKLGSDQTDYFFHVLASAVTESFEVRANVGVGIVSDPIGTGKQNDLFMYSAAFLLPLTNAATLFAECCGFNGYFRDDAKMVTRLGVSSKLEFLSWSIFGSVRVFGNNRDYATAFESSENWSIGFFLKKDFQF